MKLAARLRTFYGDAFDRYDGQCTKAHVEGWGGDTFQLALNATDLAQQRRRRD